MLIIFGTISKGYGQITYTSAPCASGLWSDASCWTRSGSCSGNVTIPSVPPFVGISNNCAVTVNLNHPRTVSGDFASGSGFTLNMNASLTINGNLTSTNQGSTTINVFGGVLTANLVEVKNDFNLVIHNGAEAIFDELDLNGSQVTIDIRAGGNLTVFGETKMRGNRSDILVAGNFETGSIDVAGATNNITTTGGSNVYVSDPEGGITIAGNSTLNITGQSEVVVEGSVEVNGGNLNVTETASLTIYTDFLVNGGSNINITTQGEVYVCGMRPEPEEIDQIDDDAIYEILDDPILCNITIMPVSLKYFESAWHQEERRTSLKWATTIEKGNSHFEIERSLGGTKDFEKIGEVQGMGWKDTLTEYDFKDSDIPLSGGNILYRLKQVGFEGGITFSKVISVRIPSIQVTKGAWRVYPNPTTGEQFKLERIRIEELEQGNIEVRLVAPSAEGIQISGSDLKEISNQLHQKLMTVPNGIYILEVNWDQKIEYLKIIKQ
ncbi:T9SS type A sorting domain-containing protein [Shivajiella indica]|uniref:T9SS type A sorting domain-containing protein n=1 Tax=Shivajiella indica TaxID=872115 RepID=A0ABW5BFG9_9BACT